MPTFIGQHGLEDGTSRPMRMMHRSDKVITPPAGEPVTLAQAKDWCRIPAAVTKDNDTITALIQAAREQVETFTRRQLVTTVWEVIYDRFPGPYGAGGNLFGFFGFETFGFFELPKNPVQSVDEIRYIDTTGTEVTLANTEYIVDVDAEPARITPAVDTFWPATDIRITTVKVKFTAGYGLHTDDPILVPQALFY